MKGGWSMKPLKPGHHWPTSETPLNGVSLTCRWWPNIEYCLGSFVIFSGIWISIAKNHIFLWFSRGVRTPCSPQSGSAHVSFNLVDVSFLVWELSRCGKKSGLHCLLWSCYYVCVSVSFFIQMSWVGLWYVTVAFPGYTMVVHLDGR